MSSLKDVSLKDVSLKDVVVPKNRCQGSDSFNLLAPWLNLETDMKTEQLENYLQI